MTHPIDWTVEATRCVCNMINDGILHDGNYDEFVNRCEGHARYDCSYFVASDDVKLVAAYMIDKSADFAPTSPLKKSRIALNDVHSLIQSNQDTMAELVKGTPFEKGGV